MATTRLNDRIARLERQIVGPDLERVIVVRNHGASDDAISAFLTSKGVLVGAKDNLVTLNVLGDDSGQVEIMSISGDRPLIAGKIIPASKDQRDAAVAVALRADT